MTEAEIIAELTWNALPSELLGEAIKAVKKLAAERDEARETIAEVEGAMEMPDGWSSGLEGWTREVIGQNKSSQESLVARLDEALASESHAAKLHSNVSTELLQKEQQLAEAREEHKFCDLFLNSANAELKRCESALRLALAGTGQRYFAIPARIDDVRAALADAQAQLAEARAEVERLEKERDDARAEAAKLKEQNRILATTSLRDVIKSVHPGGRARGQ